jgi:FHS family glucose/mannose:H+ symporter-like MFS transporter
MVHHIEPISPKIILPLACTIFLIFGLFQASIGPILGELSEKNGSSLAAIGGVLTFLFLGSLIAQIVSGPLIDHFGQKSILIISLFTISLSIIGFTKTHNLPWVFFMFLFAGLGQGGIDMGANLVVADAFPKNNTSFLNLMHFFFGIGAFIGPALVGFAIAKTGSGFIIQRIAAGIFFSLAFATIFLLRNTLQKKANDDPLREEKSEGIKVYLSPLLWMLSCLMLIYIGIEYGLGSWISRYKNITTNMASQNGALVNSAYWGALALGRLAGVVLSRKLSHIQLLLLSIGSSLVGGIGLVISHNLIIPTIIFLIWISFSYGTVIPTTVAFASTAFPKHKGKAVSVLAAMGSIGGITLPWFAGSLLGKSASLGYTWFITFSIFLLLIILFFINRIKDRNHYAGIE